MQLNLTPEIEQIAKAAVSAGAYESVDAFIQAAVRDKAAEVTSTLLPEDDTDEWIEKLYALGAMHKATGHSVDDSRGSIYPDRT